MKKKMKLIFAILVAVTVSFILFALNIQADETGNKQKINDNYANYKKFDCLNLLGSVNSNEKDYKNRYDKICALTFDDGPDSTKTELVLDKLEQYGIKSTFFMIGKNINSETASVIQRLVDGGNEIGNHSNGYSSLDTVSANEVRKSVKITNNLIHRYTGLKANFFRPPNLAISTTLQENVGMPIACGILAHDWAGENTSAQQRADYILSQISDGAIVLMHDNQPDPHPTPEALDIIIPELQSRGYKCVTISELFKRKGVTPIDGQVYNSAN